MVLADLHTLVRFPFSVFRFPFSVGCLMKATVHKLKMLGPCGCGLTGRYICDVLMIVEYQLEEQCVSLSMMCLCGEVLVRFPFSIQCSSAGAPQLECSYAGPFSVFRFPFSVGCLIKATLHKLKMTVNSLMNQ